MCVVCTQRPTTASGRPGASVSVERRSTDFGRASPRHALGRANRVVPASPEVFYRVSDAASGARGIDAVDTVQRVGVRSCLISLYHRC